MELGQRTELANALLKHLVLSGQSLGLGLVECTFVPWCTKKPVIPRMIVGRRKGP